MIKKLMTIAVPVLALVGGAFGGDMLRGSAAKDDTHAEAGAEDGAEVAVAKPEHTMGEPAWFRFPTQFFVPLVRQGDMRDMMILTLTLQTDAETLPKLAKKEHALRDTLLRQLMIHANTGGFDGNFTADRNLAALRESLAAAARAATDLPVSAVLIEDIARHSG